MRRTFVVVVGAVLMALPAGAVHAHPGHTATPDPAPTSVALVYGDGWATLAPIAGGPRQEHSVAAIGDEVFVIGGMHASPAGDLVTTDRVEVYDTRHDTWSEASPLPVPMNHANVAAVDGKIYVLGGLSGGASWEALPDSFVYDPATDRWSELPPMPAGEERGSAAVGVQGSRIYLAGGMRTLTPVAGGLHDTVATTSSFDARTFQWETLPSLPEARDHVGGAVVRGTLYVLGGRDRGQANVRDTVYALDLDSRQWTERSPMPTARGGLATAVVGTTIYAFGGEGNPAGGSEGLYAENEAYDTKRDRWETLAPMPEPRHGTAAVAVKRTIYIPGGGDAVGGSPVDVNDSYGVGRK